MMMMMMMMMMMIIINVSSFTFIKYIKKYYENIGLENKIRWLRGLGCLGAETNVFQCGVLDWGQIGVCSWDAVAAAICSNNESMWYTFTWF
jgi:hypothetical protein